VYSVSFTRIVNSDDRYPNLHALESNDKRTSCRTANPDVWVATIQYEADHQQRDDVEKEYTVAKSTVSADC